MEMRVIQLILSVVLLFIGIGAIVHFVITCYERTEKNRNFIAYEARVLSESIQVKQYQVKQRKKEWNWKDELVLKNIERKIKSCCRKGERKLIISDSTSPRVLAKLQSNGYNLSKEGAPIDFKIFIVVEW